jgi:hypothetical protein
MPIRSIVWREHLRRQRGFSRKKKMESTMTRLTALVAVALLSIVSITPALAQAAISEPGVFQAMFPNRDVLNGGALTPAGRIGLELPGGAVNAYATNNAYARVGRDDQGVAGPEKPLPRISRRR